MDIALLIGASALIFYFGPRMSVLAERIADALGWTHAISGAVFLGLATSLSGTVVSASAAYSGDADLALSNGLGGIAAQTAFLAIADCFHPKKNLEHDAGSVVNLFQMALLLVLLSCIMMAFITPPVSLGIIHPVSILLPLAWIVGQYVAHRTGKSRPWSPRGLRDADDHSGDIEEGEDPRRSKRRMFLHFVILAAIVGVAGYVLSIKAPVLAARLGISTSAVGFVFTATITSMPELVTTIAAVRRGALALAVGNIAGGNAFDTLFCSISDVAYLEGSIYHAVGMHERFITLLGMLLTGILLMGLITRERRGFARIGTEGLLILLVYALGVVAVSMMPA